MNELREKIKQAIAEKNGYADWLQISMTDNEECQEDIEQLLLEYEKEVDFIESFIQSQPISKEFDAWISVEDKLPEDVIFNCLVCLDNNAIFEAIYSSVTKRFWSITHGEFINDNPVTHWMPLPNPPKK